MSPNLVEVDSLEAIVIVDNELDPLSPPPPDTVQVSGLMGSLAMNSPHALTNRGDASKELQMEDICCSAHGLSILVVRLSHPICECMTDPNRLPPKAMSNTRFCSMPVRRMTSGVEMHDACDQTSPP